MSDMDNIRLFIKKNAISKVKMAINYEDTHTAYKYNYNGINLIFKEFYCNNDNTNDITNDSYIHLIYNHKTYESFNDIQLILFELFDYKTIEYIDIYLQKKLEKTQSFLTDLYNDYYDDIQDKLICTRKITSNESDIIKLKFVIIEKTEITLYYQEETIQGFDEIIKKIDEIIAKIKN